MRMLPEATAKVGLCASQTTVLGLAAPVVGATGGPRGHKARPATRQSACQCGAGKAMTVLPGPCPLSSGNPCTKRDNGVSHCHPLGRLPLCARNLSSLITRLVSLPETWKPSLGEPVWRPRASGMEVAPACTQGG